MIHIHLHTDRSNSILTDSPNNLHDYINYAKNNNYKGLIFTEHGNCLSWYHKKMYLEKAGYKYIHAVEGYVCENIEEKASYHILVYALNYKGLMEVNRLITNAYNRVDGHFYKRPRFTIDELLSCKNVIISTACLGGVLAGKNEQLKKKLLQWGIENKDKFFLEIQPHNSQDQIKYNVYLIDLSKQYGLNLIASNDVHYVGCKDGEIRKEMQKSKHMDFTDEDAFDLSMKNETQMITEFLAQGLDINDINIAIENTKRLYDMPEEFDIDKSFKFPHIYDNPMQHMVDRCIQKFHEYGFTGNKEYSDRLMDELETYKDMGAESYMLLFSDWHEGCIDKGIEWGFSRGSASGSLVSYLLGITDVDPILWNTSFSRFMNKHRVTLPDIDVDIPPSQRDLAKQWFYDHPKLNCSEILALGTDQEKGAIDSICRAKGIPLDEVKKIKDNITEARKNEEYQELFEMVDMLNGCVTSISSHPAGVLVTDRDINSEIGLITVSDKDAKNGYRVVSQLNMKELEELGYVKADALGLANIGVINRTFKYIGKPRLNPQTCDFNDMNVWNEIKKSPVGIFQFEAPASHQQLCMAIDNIKGADLIQVMSMTSGIIRPSGASIRNDYLTGNKYDNGHDAINELFKNNSGYIVYQEDIMLFLKEFCGYNDHEADTVRRGIAKKTGTESLVDEIKERFINYFSEKYNVSKEKCEELIQGFLKIVDDASSYGFSYNHSLPYSITGFICGYLRCYYPKEYYTAMLNEFKDKPDKKKEIYRQIISNSNTLIEPPVFGRSSSDYEYDKEKDVIYEGLLGMNGVSKKANDELLKVENPKDFLDLLLQIKDKGLGIKISDINALIKIDFFRGFGGQKYLLNIVDLFYNQIKYNPKQTEKTKIKKIEQLKEAINTLNPEEDYSYAEKMLNELSILGRTSKKMDYLKNDPLYILDLTKPYPSQYILKGFNMRTGDVETYKVSRNDMIDVKKEDVIIANNIVEKEKKQQIDGKWVGGTGIFYKWITSMSKVNF